MSVAPETHGMTTPKERDTMSDWNKDIVDKSWEDERQEDIRGNQEAKPEDETEAAGETEDETGAETEDETGAESEDEMGADSEDEEPCCACGCSATGGPYICHYCGTDQTANVSDDDWNRQVAPRCGANAGITWPLCKLESGDWRTIFWDMVNEKLSPWYEAVRRDRTATTLPFHFGVQQQDHHRVHPRDLPQEIMDRISSLLDFDSRYAAWTALSGLQEAVEDRLRRYCARQATSSLHPIFLGTTVPYKARHGLRPEPLEVLETLLEDYLEQEQLRYSWYVPARIHQSPELSAATIKSLNELYTVTNPGLGHIRQDVPRWLDLSQVCISPYFWSLFPGRFDTSFGHFTIELIPYYDHLTASPQVYDESYFSMIANMHVTIPPCEVLGIYGENYGAVDNEMRQIGRVANKEGVTIRDLLGALRYSTREAIDGHIEYTERDLAMLDAHWGNSDARGRNRILNSLICGPSPRLRVKLEPLHSSSDPDEIIFMSVPRHRSTDRWQKGVWHDVFREWFADRLRQPAAWDEYIEGIRREEKR